MPREPQHQTGQVIVAHCFSVQFLTVRLGTAIKCPASPGSAVPSMQLAPGRCRVPGELVNPVANLRCSARGTSTWFLVVIVQAKARLTPKKPLAAATDSQVGTE